MVSINFKDGNIIVVFSKKERTVYHKELKKEDSQAVIEGEIRRALESAAWEHADRKGEITAAAGNVKKWAAEIKNQLEGVKAQEKKEEKPPEKKTAPVKPAPAKASEKPAAPSIADIQKLQRLAREAEKKTRREAAQAAKQEAAARAKAEKQKAKAEKAQKIMPTKPQPVRDAAFIRKQLDELQKGKRMNEAIDTLHSNSGYIGKYLASRGDINRTEEQKAATVAVFNALWQVPKFHFMLSALKDRMQEFGTLNEYLKANKTLGASAENGIIVAADMYARYFLLAHIAQGNKKFREEIGQLPDIAERLKGVDYVLGYSGEPTQKTKDEVLKNKIFGAMDADTVTAAALYMRRWNLEHPETGEGKKQEDISVWEAPAIIVPQEERKAEPPTEKPKERSPLEKFAEQKWRDLRSEFFMDATKGNVSGLVVLMKDPGPDQRSIETALSTLKRDDMDRATDSLFNDFFKKNETFGISAGAATNTAG